MEIEAVETMVQEAQDQSEYDLAFTRTYMILSCPGTQKSWPTWRITDLDKRRVLVRTDQQEAWVRQTNGIPVRENEISCPAQQELVQVV